MGDGLLHCVEKGGWYPTITILHYQPSLLVSCLDSIQYLHSCTDTATVWKDSRLILSERSDFHMIDNLSIVEINFPVCMLKLSSIEILRALLNKS